MPRYVHSFRFVLPLSEHISLVVKRAMKCFVFESDTSSKQILLANIFKYVFHLYFLSLFL